MPRKSKKPRAFKARAGTSFDFKTLTLITLTPAGDNLDVVLRTLHEDTHYDHENYRPVLVSDFNGNESDSSSRTDYLSDDGTDEEYPEI